LSGNPAEAARLAHAQIVQLSGDTVCRMAINMSWRPMTADWTIEQTDNALNADQRNFYEVEKWTKDGSKIDCLLYAGSSLDKAHEIFATAVKHRPRIRLCIRQRTKVLEEWPQAAK
jgi:hypothetical protein